MTIIHIRQGLTSRQLDITGWKTGEWVEIDNGEKKRLLVRPDGITYQDYMRLDGKHDLIKVEEKNKTKKIEKENKELKKAITEKEISLEQKESPELALYKFIAEQEIDFCIDQFGNHVAVHKNKYYDIVGAEFETLINKKHFLEKGKVPNTSVWKKALVVLKGDCDEKNQFFPIRTYTKEKKLYYDDGQLVWEFNNGEHKTYDKDSKDCPVIFRRNKIQKKAEIKPNEKQTKELFKPITTMFNLEDYREESILPMFSSEHPNPMGLFIGEPGAAKSTFTLFIKRLIDPDEIEKLSIPDKNNLSEFNMHRQNFAVILYDNIREFTKEQSDQLCMMITGSSGLARELYTNGGLYVTKGKPRILANGIRPEPSNFNDLLDRTLIVDMQRIENSRPERVIWEKIDETLPELRYCCLRDVSKALYDEQIETEGLPRMSEYCLMAESISRIWGNEEGSFIEWFTKRMEISHATGMDDPFMIVLEGYLKHNNLLLQTEGMKCTGSEWRAKITDWCEEKLNLGVGYDGSVKEGQYLRKDMYRLSQEKEFPRNATWIGRRFKDLTPLLRVKGYFVEQIKTSDERYIKVYINK